MNKETINQQAKRIEECCNRIANSNPSEEISQELSIIKDCCRNIEETV
ncbi:hypothetical protein [Filobacillus milosensis]|nr:hypothetical protein [Filobacillus milosensis]